MPMPGRSLNLSTPDWYQATAASSRTPWTSSPWENDCYREGKSRVTLHIFITTFSLALMHYAHLRKCGNITSEKVNCPFRWRKSPVLASWISQLFCIYTLYKINNHAPLLGIFSITQCWKAGSPGIFLILRILYCMSLLSFLVSGTAAARSLQQTLSLFSTTVSCSTRTRRRWEWPDMPWGASLRAAGRSSTQIRTNRSLWSSPWWWGFILLVLSPSQSRSLHFC